MTPSIQITDTSAEQTDDWDKLILNYIFTNWTETNPAKGSAPIDNSNNTFVRFRLGIPDYTHAYEINVLETETIPDLSQGGHGYRYWMQTTILIGIRMKRLDRDRPDPQLGKMEREIQRLAMTYITFASPPIAGAKVMTWGGQQRVYNATDNYAKSDWRTEARINITYEKTVLA